MAQQTVTIQPSPGSEIYTRRLPFYVDVLRRLVTEKPLGLAGGIIFVFMCLAALTAPFAASDPNALGLGSERLLSPSMSHPFGTDNLGRDVLTRVIWGARVSLFVGFTAVIVSTIISLTLGIVSGFFGGIFDMIVQRLVDAFIAFPGLVLLLAVVAMFRDWHAPGLPRDGLFSTGVVVLIATLGVLGGVSQSRIIRGAVLSLKESMFVEAARATGAGNTRMIFVHILPNVMAPIITLATLGLGTVILAEASLSFLGLGLPPDVPSWGGMLNREARSFITQAWWLGIFPGVALSLAVFAFNMLGDALRDILDPRMRGSR
jgi:peptide/nickel transport system permease protein